MTDLETIIELLESSKTLSRDLMRSLVNFSYYNTGDEFFITIENENSYVVKLESDFKSKFDIKPEGYLPIKSWTFKKD